MGYCCGEHLSRKVDSIVIDYDCPAEVKLLKIDGIGISGDPQGCDFCLTPARYLVTVTMNPGDWISEIRDVETYAYTDREIHEPHIHKPHEIAHEPMYGADTAPEVMEDIRMSANPVAKKHVY